jgi:hypothetical protein
MTDISNYVSMAEEMLEDDKDRNELYSGIDDMWHGAWSADPALKAKPDFREVIDLSPHDALRAGTTLMANTFPKWKVQPFAPNSGERDKAEKIEYILDWHFKRMCQRGGGSVLWDMVHSALRYDAIAIWLDYLPYWVGKKPTGRAKYALRRGPFNATVYNPSLIHVRADTFGNNCVLHAMNKTADSVAQYWKARAGKQGPDFEKFMTEYKKRGTEEDNYFNHFDMMLYDEDDKIRRIVWGSFSDDTDLDAHANDEYVLMDEVVDLPFMPWIIKIGGSNMESESQYSVHPLLAPLYWTHKWEDQNIYESLVHSEIVKYARSPRVITKTPSGEGLDIDFADGASINARTGMEDAAPWQPAPLDANLKEMLDRGKASISSATLPRILQNPEFAGNTPFASINAIIQTAIGSLNTSKILCEMAGEELGIRMFEWASSQNDTLYAYRSADVKGEDMVFETGSEVAITPKDYSLDDLLLTCTFTTETPTDFNQRLNAEILMVQQLDYPKTNALEDLGKMDSELLIERRVQEKYDEMTINLDLQRQMADLQLETQAKQMQLQMAAQQAAASQQQAAPGQQTIPQQGNQMEPSGAQQAAMAAQQMGQGGGYPSNAQGTPPTEMGVPPGFGFNPNAGGMSPAVGNPAANNRENATGTDQTGRPIA